VVVDLICIGVTCLEVSSGMDEIGVRTHVWRVFCVHGSDESCSEPYLWVAGFKLDGATLHQRSNRLSWTPDLFFSEGSHGNLETAADPGMKIVVPPGVGVWDTTLTPLTLVDERGRTTTAPGVLGVVAALLEENNVPDHAAEVAHQAFNRFVTERLERFLTGLDLGDLHASINTRVARGALVQQAVSDEIRTRFMELRRTVADGAAEVVSTATQEELGISPSVWPGIDKDELIGIGFHVVTTTDLLAEPDFTIEFNDHIFDNPYAPAGGRFAYNLRSYLKARMRRRPVQPRLPAGRAMEIQGTARRLSQVLGMRYVYQIGGVVNGAPWWLSRSAAASLIASEEREFYVRTPENATIPVTVVSPPGAYWSYLTTSPDGRSDNELLSLPRLSTVPGFHRFVVEPE
jgi:hypothetical protein